MENTTIKILLIAVLIALIGMAKYRVVWTEWDPPKTNTDGTPLIDLAGYNIYISPVPSPTPGGDQLIFRLPIIKIGSEYTRWPLWVAIGDQYAVQISAYNSIGVESQLTQPVYIKGRP